MIILALLLIAASIGFAYFLAYTTVFIIAWAFGVAFSTKAMWLLFATILCRGCVFGIKNTMDN